MSLRNYTAADLGITGPHLIAHTLDGDRPIVDEVLGYVVDRCNVTARTKEWTAVFTYRAPGVDEPITGRVPVRRLTVAGLHCDGANQLVPQRERGVTRRAKERSSDYDGDSKTAPAGNRGLSPSEAAKPHGRTCLTW
jgi:hypothetical protein